MVVNGEVYTAVMLTWEEALLVANGEDHLKDWLPGDKHGGRYVQRNTFLPGLLYDLNSHGLFIPRAGTSGDDGGRTSTMSREIAEIRRNGLEAMNTVYSAVQQSSQAILALGSRLDSTVHSVNSVIALQLHNSEVSQARQEVSDLRQERRHVESMISLNPSPEATAANFLRLQELDAEIGERRADLRTIEAQKSSINASLTASMDAAAGAGQPLLGAPVVPPGLAPPAQGAAGPSNTAHSQSSKFESAGIKSDGGRSGKWGVILGVRHGLHAQPVPVDDRLRGRLVAVDIVIGTEGGRGFIHRFIGIYAPWDPGTQLALLSEFWTLVSAVCRDAPHSWTLMGDYNTTLSPSESLAQADRYSASRDGYTSLLRTTDGFDIWQTQHDADARTSYTCKAGSGQSVIDRVSASRRGTVTAFACVLHNFIPATDHRPVLATIVLSPPLRLAGATLALDRDIPRSTYPPRLLFPKRGEKHRFDNFSQSVDDAVRAQHLADHPVTDDNSFNRRYDALTRIFRSSGIDAFGTPTVKPPEPFAKPRTPRILSLVSEFRRVNRLIGAVKQHRLSSFAADNAWARDYLEDHQLGGKRAEAPLGGHDFFITFAALV
ncbi:hypothetical protein PsYK624_126740 [Phanerochaete sordida]|uniref:Endonuclease/exonuclease/phosphatase domain-containing protein n=1 Tax=Phanerochaete sordida TaxID=48140 RepID=A0A9P3LJR4_9APHY|nr:hypothetical protein PsYK624_126740 [Phanerochaete sordida]